MTSISHRFRISLVGLLKIVDHILGNVFLFNALVNQLPQEVSLGHILPVGYDLEFRFYVFADLCRNSFFVFSHVPQLHNYISKCYPTVQHAFGVEKEINDIQCNSET